MFFCQPVCIVQFSLMNQVPLGTNHFVTPEFIPVPIAECATNFQNAFHLRPKEALHFS